MDRCRRIAVLVVLNSIENLVNLNNMLEAIVKSVQRKWKVC